MLSFHLVGMTLSTSFFTEDCGLTQVFLLAVELRSREVSFDGEFLGFPQGIGNIAHDVGRYKLHFSPLIGEKWCPRGDSNPHAVRHRLLRPACLPIPPPGQGRDANHTGRRVPRQT